MDADGRLHELVFHGVKDQIDPLVNPEFSVDRSQVIAQRMLAEV
jgi:hypothetical protein